MYTTIPVVQDLPCSLWNSGELCDWLKPLHKALNLHKAAEESKNTLKTCYTLDQNMYSTFIFLLLSLL